MVPWFDGVVYFRSWVLGYFVGSRKQTVYHGWYLCSCSLILHDITDLLYHCGYRKLEVRRVKLTLIWFRGYRPADITWCIFISVVGGSHLQNQKVSRTDRTLWMAPSQFFVHWQAANEWKVRWVDGYSIVYLKYPARKDIAGLSIINYIYRDYRVYIYIYIYTIYILYIYTIYTYIHIYIHTLYIYTLYIYTI